MNEILLILLLSFAIAYGIFIIAVLIGYGIDRDEKRKTEKSNAQIMGEEDYSPVRVLVYFVLTILLLPIILIGELFNE